MMTQPPDLDAIATLAREAKARADRAAPGPWEWSFATLYNRVTICNGRTICTDGGRQAGRPDIAFIAAARTDVPALADAVLALVERVRELERGPVMPEKPSDEVCWHVEVCLESMFDRADPSDVNRVWETIRGALLVEWR